MSLSGTEGSAPAWVPSTTTDAAAVSRGGAVAPTRSPRQRRGWSQGTARISSAEVFLQNQLSLMDPL